MGSAIYMITCEKCGKLGYIDDDYKEGIKITGCDSCGYKKEETYKVERWDDEDKDIEECSDSNAP